MIEKFFSTVFDQEHEFQDIWELKLIKFDTDLDQKRKGYQQYLMTSDMVEDVKGNPGFQGMFYLTNLRIIWHSRSDKDLNLSIGLDTINNVMLKTVPLQGYNEMRFMMTLKCVSPKQTKYQFKFSGFTHKQETMFNAINQMYKAFSKTRLYRNIDTTVKLVNSDFTPLLGQEVKTTYNDGFLEQNGKKKEIIIILTNLRVILIHKYQTLNYGIPWIMIDSFNKADKDLREVLQLKIRGILKSVQLYIWLIQRKDFIKMHKQMISFSQIFNKSPNFGVDYKQLNVNQDKAIENIPKIMNVVEIQQQTKVNIGRRKNAYGDDNQQGSLKNTFFNEQLGIMMERMAQGCTRQDYWQILRS